MSKCRVVKPVFLICGILAVDEERLRRAQERLEAEIDRVATESPVIPFTFTDYYAAEMGPGLLRKFVTFRDLVDPFCLPDLKHLTMGIEEELAVTHEPLRRGVNLDPGYITAAKLVLATTKNYAHRIYLRNGIFAEITLNFTREHTCKYYEWTYPDYRSEAYSRFFLRCRERML